jgi:hypothetical protein
MAQQVMEVVVQEDLVVLAVQVKGVLGLQEV